MKIRNEDGSLNEEYISRRWELVSRIKGELRARMNSALLGFTHDPAQLPRAMDMLGEVAAALNDYDQLLKEAEQKVEEPAKVVERAPTTRIFDVQVKRPFTAAILSDVGNLMHAPENDKYRRKREGVGNQIKVVCGKKPLWRADNYSYHAELTEEQVEKVAAIPLVVRVTEKL